MNQEQLRLKEAHEKKIPWKKWGPYLSERQWGTVRGFTIPPGGRDLPEVNNLTGEQILIGYRHAVRRFYRYGPRCDRVS
ncbi:MAG: hypothetical protein WBD99_09805 [Thermodesulfobacteriota bacterium]